MKIAVWVESLLGYGHAVRINTLLQMTAPYEALICSGSISHSSYLKSLFAQYTLLDLTSLTLRDTTKPYPRIASSGQLLEEIIGQRVESLTREIYSFKPSHFVVEHFPFGRHGFAREIVQVITVLRKLLPQCRILCSVRDFAGAQPLEPIYQTMMSSYLSLFDSIMIHGRREIMDISMLYPELKEIESKTVYTGYLYQDEPMSYNPIGSCFLDLGGGYNAKELIASSFYENLRSVFLKPIVVMKGVHSSAHVYSGHSDEPLPGSFGDISIINDYSKKNLGAKGVSLMISRVGYNSACEILRNKIPTIIVPHGFSFEQQLRAAVIDQIERGVCMPNIGSMDDKGLVRNLVEQAIERAASWNVEEFQWLFAGKESLQQVFQA